MADMQSVSLLDKILEWGGLVVGFCLVAVWKMVNGQVKGIRDDIEKVEAMAVENRESLAESLQEHRNGVHARINRQEEKFTKALEKIVDRFDENYTSINTCEQNQKWWTLKIESMITAITQQQETSDNANTEQHQSIIATLTQTTSELKELREDLNKFAVTRK